MYRPRAPSATYPCRVGLILFVLSIPWSFAFAAALREGETTQARDDDRVVLERPVTDHAQLSASSAEPSAAPPPDGLFRDCADCPQMIVIPAGRFLMGAAPGEEKREDLAEEFRHRSEPQRQVIVERFAAGRFEISRGEYRVFAATTGRSTDGCFVWAADRFELDRRRHWHDPGFAQDDSHPAVCVSWQDADAYTRWLSQRTGKSYRLLSEAEWEYAARAGSATSRYWGDDGNMACAYTNGADRATAARAPGAGAFGFASCDDGHAYTAPVGRFRPNAFGLHDMLGNVGEWTQDCWNDNYDGARTDGRAVLTGDCGMRAVRGGSWDDAPTGLRAAYRVGSPTTVRLYSRGFRVARNM